MVPGNTSAVANAPRTRWGGRDSWGWAAPASAGANGGRLWPHRWPQERVALSRDQIVFPATRRSCRRPDCARAGRIEGTKSQFVDELETDRLVASAWLRVIVQHARHKHPESFPSTGRCFGLRPQRDVRASDSGRFWESPQEDRGLNLARRDSRPSETPHRHKDAAFRCRPLPRSAYPRRQPATFGGEGAPSKPARSLRSWWTQELPGRRRRECSVLVNLFKITKDA